METEVRRVKCVSTCDTLSIMRGDCCVLPLPKARMLESMGAVKILDKLCGNKAKIADNDYLYRYTFAKRRLTRVAWVQNYDVNGGAEISNFDAVAAAADLGFDVVGVNISDYKSNDIMNKADVIVVNNLLSPNREEVIAYLAQTKVPWVRYDHDCVEWNETIYRKASKIIFISPLHKAHYVAKFGQQLEEKSICLPLAFNVDKWPLVTNGRIENSVFIPSYYKCRENAMRYINEHPEKKFFIAGTVRPVGNTEALGEIHYSDMPKYYQQFESVLHLPYEVRAGERIVFEAVLSGCNVIINDLVGHGTWDFDWRDERVLRPMLRRAIIQFWHEVDEVAHGS